MGGEKLKQNSKMKTLRMFATTLMMVVLCLNFSACGDDDDKDAPSNYFTAEELEAVLISFDKFVKHDLDECDLYHDFRSFSEEFIIDG